MNLPNKLTVARLALTVVFVVMFYLPVPNAISWALVIFIVAAVTDYFDGEIARRHNLVTNFGKLMDPLADKILMTAALILVAAEDSLCGAVPVWLVIAVLAREFFVTGIRQLAAQAGVVLAAERLGKHKMVWQIITVIYFMAKMAGGEPMLAWAAPAFLWPPFSPEVFGRICVLMMTGLTFISGFSYFWKNRKLFSDA
ncbi:MAG: CDP-diacylglycerol--glycerol-3-phosphate 3-phosphatidyltransferase [Roseimicrobium sp.]